MDDDRVLIVAVDQPFVRNLTLERLTELESRIPIVPVAADTKTGP
jgi:CTP:molybdopterin cytidylyltransferase MocA